jgi:hypothetical protein
MNIGTEVVYNRYEDNANWDYDAVRALPSHSGLLGTPELTFCVPDYIGVHYVCSGRASHLTVQQATRLQVARESTQTALERYATREDLAELCSLQRRYKMLGSNPDLKEHQFPANAIAADLESSAAVMTKRSEVPVAVAPEL